MEDDVMKDDSEFFIDVDANPLFVIVILDCFDGYDIFKPSSSSVSLLLGRERIVMIVYLIVT